MQTMVMGKHLPILAADLYPNGEIGWLWLTEPGKRPRPVKDMATCLQRLDTLILVGASKPKIKAWLIHQIKSTPGS
jgi:hypothetical protein